MGGDEGGYEPSPSEVVVRVFGGLASFLVTGLLVLLYWLVYLLFWFQILGLLVDDREGLIWGEGIRSRVGAINVSRYIIIVIEGGGLLMMSCGALCLLFGFDAVLSGLERRPYDMWFYAGSCLVSLAIVTNLLSAFFGFYRKTRRRMKEERQGTPPQSA